MNSIYIYSKMSPCWETWGYVQCPWQAHCLYVFSLPEFLYARAIITFIE